MKKVIFLQLKKLELKNIYMSSNCYLLIKNNELVVIDPGFPDEKLFNYIKDNNLKLNKIILTHGHYDHWTGLEELLKRYPNTKVYASTLDDYWFKNNPFTIYFPKIDYDLKSLKYLEILDESFEVIKTPGHSKGSITLYNKKDNYIISGDVLFYGSIGRTDLYGGNFDILKDSIYKLYEILNDDTIVYSGHGNETKIGFEKKHNPFVRI